MRLKLLLISFFTLAACSSQPENNTFFPYSYQPNEILKPGSTVIIASSNLGAPSRKYLQTYEPRIDGILRNYLEDNGYNVISSRLFNEPYSNAIALYGSPYDQYTGKLDNKQLIQVLANTFEQLKSETDADAVIFTDVIERQAAVVRTSSKRFVRFDGVQRNMRLQGTGQGVSTTFNWNAPVDVATLSLNIFTLKDGKRVFNGRGGLEPTQAIDTRKDAFSRARSLFKDDKFIKEGVEIAIHPLIPTELYQESSE